MLTVATVLRASDVYSVAWVARLQVLVARHLKRPHRFVCLSDVDVPCERIPLRYEWPRWWAKIELLSLEGTVLYFDLDTLPIGDLSDIAGVAEESDFAMLRDFYRPLGLGSGVMGWSGGDQVPLDLWFEAFESDPEYWMNLCSGGDQHFLEIMVQRLGVQVSRFQECVPDQIVSYKAHHCQDAPPPGARLMCLHGRPKFGDMAHTSWARRLWEAAA